MICRYCSGEAVCMIRWVRGSFSKPGPVFVPYCGTCSIKDALAKRGMTAPVTEGVDYTFDPLNPTVDHHNAG